MIEDCGRAIKSKGLCSTHYYRQRRGHPAMDAPVVDRRSETLADRVARNTQTTDHGLVWVGGMSGVYGSFGFHGKQWWAHRAAYTVAYGPIPEGMEVDHDEGCPRLCVTPEHMTLRTKSEHARVSWTRSDNRTGRPAQRGCLIDGCPHPHKCKGYCINHYSNLWRTGNPLGNGLTVQRDPATGRFGSVGVT